MPLSFRVQPQTRSGTRSTGFKRSTRRKLSLATLLLLAAGGCETAAPQDQDDLQALLHDAPLTSIKVSSEQARTTAQPAGHVHALADDPPLDMAVPPDFGGTGGSDGGSDGGTNPPPPPFGPLGRWSFDDCNPSRTNLSDSSPNFDTAFRTVSTSCAQGIANQGVALALPADDLVYVPDQPFFNFSTGVTVGGWFKATAVSKTRTLFRKRDDADSSSFALVLHNSKYQFVINLGQGRVASVTAPTKAKANEWTHVAATYDNNTLRLYVNGSEVANFGVAGTLVPAAGPFLMGNDGSKRLFAGSIDNAFLDARALSPTEVAQLTCVNQAPSLTATPAISEPTQAGVPASFDVPLWPPRLRAGGGATGVSSSRRADPLRM